MSLLTHAELRTLEKAANIIDKIAEDSQHKQQLADDLRQLVVELAPFTGEKT